MKNTDCNVRQNQRLSIQSKSQLFIVIVLAFLTLLAIMASCKTILFGLLSDEEYAVSMAWRLANGEHLFTDLWDPHQMSAFPCQWLTMLYQFFHEGTEGLILFLRFCGMLFQGIVALVVYRTLRLRYKPVLSYFCSLITFILLPKYIQIPEFSNLFLWSLTMVCMMLLRCHFAPHPARNIFRLVVGALFYCCMILSYPTALLLAPFFLFILWKNLSFLRGALPFFGTCLLTGTLYLLYLFSYMTPAQLLQGISHMSSDGSHAISGWDRLLFYAHEFDHLILLSAPLLFVAALLSSILCKCKWKEALRTKCFASLFLLLSCTEQLLIWLFGGQYINRPLAFFYVAALLPLFINGRNKRELLQCCILPAWLGVLSVLLLTNTTIGYSGPFLLPAILAALLLLGDLEEATETMDSKQFLIKMDLQISPLLCRIAALSLIGILLFSKGLLACMEEGVKDTAFFPKQKALSGPAQNIYCSYMNGYCINQFHWIIGEYLSPNDVVLYVGAHSARIMELPGTFSNASTISTPTYDESLLTYWETYPEKYPTVVVAEYDQADPDLNAIRAFLPLGELIFESKEFRVFSVAGTP